LARHLELLMINILLVLAAVAVAIWLLSDILLLAFAALLIAVILDGMTRLVCRALPFVNRMVSLVLALLVLIATMAGAVFLMGMRVKEELTFLYEQLPDAIDALGERMGINDPLGAMGEQLVNFAGEGGLIGQVAGYTSAVFGGAASLVLVIVGGVYLAANPGLYVDGVRKLFPPRKSERVTSAMGNSGRALKLWLVGQFITMIVVGVATTLGLWAIGVPSALGLGVLAGIFEFVPIVGPVIAAVPAILVGLSEGNGMVYWIIALYVIIQQLEGAILIPLIQQRTVSLPPVLGLFSILIFGVLFGPLGILLATPLTVVAYVLIKQVYVRETLGWEVEVPGEEKEGDASK
jgi:predicted PurR-regulated permease PerM